MYIFIQTNKKNGGLRCARKIKFRWYSVVLFVCIGTHTRKQTHIHRRSFSYCIAYFLHKTKQNEENTLKHMYIQMYVCIHVCVYSMLTAMRAI